MVVNSPARLALLLCWLPAIAAAYATTPYLTSPEAFGAVGDGKTDDSDAIGRAVESCRAHRGVCTVRFAKQYLSGPILVNSSRVTLEVTGKLMMLPKKQFLARNPQLQPFITNGIGGKRDIRITVRRASALVATPVNCWFVFQCPYFTELTHSSLFVLPPPIPRA